MDSSPGVSLDGDEENTRGVGLASDEEPPMASVVKLGREARGPLIGDLPPLLGRAGREGGDSTVVETERMFLLRVTGELVG